MRLRKDVNVYLDNPSARLFQVVVELKNVPGALSSVLQVLQDLHLNILGSFSSVDPHGKTGVWSAFVKDSRHSASELKAKISLSEYVLDSKVAESRDGFLVDGIHFPLAWNTGDRAFLGRTKHFARMLSKMREKFGTGGEVLLYEEGYNWGKETWEDFAGALRTGFARSNLDVILKLYQALGWFKLEGVEHDRQSHLVNVRTSSNFECEGEKSLRPHSDFVRGHLCGALTAILGEEMVCEETRCTAAGDRLCEFSLRPIAAVSKPAEPIAAAAK